MLRDPEVGLIVSGTGGYNSIDVALGFDASIFLEHAKPIMGMSDTSALLLDLHRRTGHAVFHGPALLSSFGEAELPSWQIAELLNNVANPTAGLCVSDPPLVTTDFQFWDRDDNNPPERIVPAERIGIGRQAVEGPLIGGNLDTLVALTAARKMPDTRGALVFVEAAFGELEKAQRDLVALEQAGAFERAAGLIFGLPFGMADGERLYNVAARLAAIHGLPMIYGLSIGHTSPINVLPIGAMARLDPQERSLCLLEDVTT
jgi:muramoyltetrapeptide carboxypeptidase LdcA involved in peptidoglycan recycling